MPILNQKASSGGGSMPVTESDGFVNSDSAVPLTGDGNHHTISVANGSPPSWLDVDGNVLGPGLYVSGLKIQTTTPPTTPGLYIAVASWGNEDWLVPVDGLARGPWTEGDIEAFQAADLPWPTQLNVRMPTDDTLAVNVFVFVQRLMTG